MFQSLPCSPRGLTAQPIAQAPIPGSNFDIFPTTVVVPPCSSSFLFPYKVLITEVGTWKERAWCGDEYYLVVVLSDFPGHPRP